MRYIFILRPLGFAFVDFRVASWHHRPPWSWQSSTAPETRSASVPTRRETGEANSFLLLVSSEMKRSVSRSAAGDRLAGQSRRGVSHQEHVDRQKHEPREAAAEESRALRVGRAGQSAYFASIHILTQMTER